MNQMALRAREAEIRQQESARQICKCGHPKSEHTDVSNDNRYTAMCNHDELHRIGWAVCGCLGFVLPSEEN